MNHPEQTARQGSGAPQGAVPPRFDLAFVRAQFPAFSEPSLEGWAFFENAGGSYACRQVIDRLDRYYRRTKVQPYFDYPASRQAGDSMDLAYAELAGHLGVGADELVLGPSTTQNAAILSRALHQTWSEGDEIVVSDQNHEANAGCWHRLAESGIVVRRWGIDPETGSLDPESLEPLLGERTRLVSLPHCSNVVGEINPVAEIARRARGVGATVVVDGVSYAPHGLPDVGALQAAGVDAYLFSLYKTYGPHLGAMTVRRELLDSLPNQSHFFHASQGRKKLLVAGPDHAQIAAATGVVVYLNAVHDHHFSDRPSSALERSRRVHDLFRDREQRLLAPLLEFLARRDDVRVIGSLDARRRAPTVALLPLRRGVEELFTGLVDRRMMLGAGDFYGVRPLRAMGIPTDPGVVRLSFVHYTSEDDVERLVEALAASLDA